MVFTVSLIRNNAPGLFKENTRILRTKRAVPSYRLSYVANVPRLESKLRVNGAPSKWTAFLSEIKSIRLLPSPGGELFATLFGRRVLKLPAGDN